MPDDELFALAAQGQLRRDLDAQVRRMLGDPKSAAFVENFAGQWLRLRKLAYVAPDPRTFPGFDEELRAAMTRETELFFEAILREDRSILDLLDADFSFVNERLAKHYGIAGVTGPEFRRVTLPPNRGRRPDAGERPDRDLEPDADLAGEARQVGARADPRHAPAARRRPTSPTLPDDEATDRLAPPADGAAPRERALRLVPPADGPARLRLRELRRHRRLARQGRRVRRSTPRARCPTASRSRGRPS